jgi:hypothetical protein
VSFLRRREIQCRNLDSRLRGNDGTRKTAADAMTYPNDLRIRQRRNSSTNTTAGAESAAVLAKIARDAGFALSIQIIK